MPGIPFDSARPSVAAARRIVLERLKGDADWQNLDDDGSGFDRYAEYLGNTGITRGILVLYSREVFWQLVNEGILAPGKDRSNADLPWFRITDHGRAVLAADPLQPHDPTGYLEALRRRISHPDPTVVAYLGESLETFRRGSIVACAVMLGIAGERVFDLVCETLLKALIDPDERRRFKALLDRYPMKPKLDWVAKKIQELQKQRLQGFPDNAPMMVTAIYDLLRSQRNDLGHPRETPPQIEREEAYANLPIFPPFYHTAEQLRTFLDQHSV